MTVFKDSNCAEVSGRFYASTNPKIRQEYNIDDLNYNFGMNDQIDSVMVPYGYSVEFFDNGGLYGTSAIVDGQMWRDEAMQMVCVNVPGSLHDKISSLAVYRTSQGYKAAGDWVSIATLTETASFTYNEGFKTTHSVEQTEREKYSLSMEMKEGMLLESSTITEGFEMEITTDT